MLLKSLRRSIYLSSCYCSCTMSTTKLPPGDAISQYRHCSFGEKKRTGEARHMMVHTEHNFRSKTTYPEILLAAMRVCKLGKSSVRYNVAIYKPKMDYESRRPSHEDEVLSNLGITLHGLIIDDEHHEIFDKLSKSFYPEPSLFGELVHVFLDENDRPRTSLPTYIKDGTMKIFCPQSKL